ncbi:MAG: ATP-binding protein [Proteobacteria bacterium]|nr:ATP-binding protein [Pseudomonadota bacterium]
MSTNNLGEMGQKLIELAGDLIAVSTKDGFFLALSREWEYVLGYPVEEIRAKTFMNFVHPEDHQITFDCLGSLKLGLDVKNFKNRYISKHGDVIWLEWCALSEADTGLIYSKARVLETDIKLEQLYLEQHKSFQANKLAILGEMAAGVAHELNNPLAIIAGYLQIMDLESNSAEGTNPEQQKILSSMMRATERATSIVENLKSLSRDASVDDLQVTSFQEIMDCSVNLLHNRFERNQVKFEYKAPTQELLLNCRRSELSQLFFNMILNALEAAQKDTDPWVKIQTSSEKQLLTVTMSNSGATIPLELRGKIFNPFFSTKLSGFGTGMGLSVAASVIQQHGGSIMIDPNNPHTTFAIKLPLLEEVP